MWYVNKYSCIAISHGKLRQYVCVWLLPMGREGEKGSYWESKLKGGALEFGPFAPLNLRTSRGITENVHYVCGGKKANKLKFDIFSCSNFPMFSVKYRQLWFTADHFYFYHRRQVWKTKQAPFRWNPRWVHIKKTIFLDLMLNMLIKLKGGMLRMLIMFCCWWWWGLRKVEMVWSGSVMQLI